MVEQRRHGGLPFRSSMEAREPDVVAGIGAIALRVDPTLAPERSKLASPSRG